jgi:hypothetical protein
MSDSEKRERGDFAVSRDSYDDDVWRRLFDAAGELEMHNSGKRWAARFEFSRDGVSAAVSDLAAAKSGGVSKIKHPERMLEEFWNQSAAGHRMKAAQEKRAV